MPGAEGLSSPEDRRRRRRRPYRQPGWIYRQDQGAAVAVTEVRMRNISPEGAGFLVDQPLRRGERLHLKVGIGPGRWPRPAQVVYLKTRFDGTFEVGVRFVR